MFRNDKKKRRSIFDVFDEIFYEFFEDLERDLQEFQRYLSRSAYRGIEESEKKGIKGPIVYGFRITVGPDGVPRIEEFGNVRKIGKKPEIAEEMEPLVDVVDEGDHVRIIAELPGVDKEDIELEAVDKTLIIRAKGKHRSYYKEVELPSRVDVDSAKAHYRNGVLEVVLKKVEKAGKGKKIKIE
jgi:HSP20 family protein